MATQTYEQLIAGANKIKENELPESNTHDIVGEQLLQMTNKMQAESSNTAKAFTDLETDRVKKTTELNISHLYPTLGVDGSNRYTLAGAIAQVEQQYRNIQGLKVSFVNESGVTETWEYKRGAWNGANFQEIGANKIETIENSTNIYNLDVNLPLTEGYYTSNKAHNAVPSKVRKLGLMITYRIDETTWVIEQFCGTLITQYGDDSKWKFIDQKGNRIINWNTNVNNTRLQIIFTERKPGMIISYNNPDKGWVTEQYIGIDSEFNSWINDNNWVELQTFSDVKIINWKTDIATTRKQIIQKERKTLLLISYENDEGDIINEQYTGTTFTDTEWVKDDNWSLIPSQKQIKELQATDSENTKMITEVDENVQILQDIISVDKVNTGKSLYLENVVANEIKVEGENYYYGGKNLIVVDDFSETKNGLTLIVENGIYNLTGTATANTTFYLPLELNFFAGDYYFYHEFLEGKCRITYKLTDNPYGSMPFAFDILVTETRNFPKTITGGLVKYLSINIQSGTVTNVSFKNMMAMGSTYEEYEYSTLPIGTTGNQTLRFKGDFCYIQSNTDFTVSYRTVEGLIDDYSDIPNKPKINGVEIVGDKSSEDYKVESIGVLSKKYKIFSEDINLSVSFVASTSGTEIPIVLDGKFNSSKYRVSIPEKLMINDPYVPGMISSTKPNKGNPYQYCIEFWHTGADFYFKLKNATLCVIVVDDIIRSNIITQATATYAHVEGLGEDRHHIRMYINGSMGSVYTSGLFEKFEKIRPLCIVDGDSISAGTGATHYVYSGMNILCEIMDWDLLNTSIGGTGYINGFNNQANMLERFEESIADNNPDILLITGGVNDRDFWYSDKEGTESNIEQYFDKVHNLIQTPYIVAFSPFTPRAFFIDEERQVGVRNKIRQMAMKYNIPFVDTMDLKTYDGIGNIISDNSSSFMYENGEELPCLIPTDKSTIYIGEDNIHPTKEGHRYIGIYKAMEVWKLLRNANGLLFNA